MQDMDGRHQRYDERKGHDGHSWMRISNVTVGLLPLLFGYKYANLSSIKQKYDPQNCELMLGMLQDISTNES